MERTDEKAPRRSSKYPWLFNIRLDSFEYYDQAPGPSALFQQKSYILHLCVDVITEHMKTLPEFPPAQKAMASAPAEILEAIQQGAR